MSCTTWKNSLMGRLYGEIEADDAAALAVHLESCADCRETLDEFRRVRTVLREDPHDAPVIPRVVVLRDRPRLRFAALAAATLGAALLAGVGAGAGYALGFRAAPVSPTTAKAVGPAAPSVATEELVRREVDRRLAALRETPPSTGATGERSVTTPELRAELAKLEKKMNGMRAADLEYVFDQIGASEFRTGARIGKTNEALRTVALASNPYVNEQ